MGLFDYVRSSYPLGEAFTDTECQSKDMERGIGGTMSQYWIDPAGRLWRVDYRDAFEFGEDPDWVDDGSKFGALFQYKFLPNGKHGKLVPQYLTDYVCIYPSQWDGEWEDWPTCRIHFSNGVLQSHENITKRQQYPSYA
jgi:hypothetical protein